MAVDWPRRPTARGHSQRPSRSIALLDPSPFASHSGDIWQYIKDAGETGLLPVGTTTGRVDLDRWVLGAAFNLEPFFVIKALFEDRRFAGIMLGQGVLKDVLGIEGLRVTYIKGRTAREDRFSLTIIIPRMEFTPFSFLGGTLTVEITPGGDMLFDLGFPWMRKSGLREWNRTVGAIIGVFQGSGGFYVERRTTFRADAQELEVRAGYAVQWGIGGVASFGPVRAMFRAGYFAVVEGRAVLDRGSFRINELALTGSGGVVVQAEVSINVWIIAARIAVLASAEALVRISWKRQAMLAGTQAAVLVAPDRTSSDITIHLRLIVGIRVVVEVSINLWLDRITIRAEFEFSLDMSTNIEV